MIGLLLLFVSNAHAVQKAWVNVPQAQIFEKMDHASTMVEERTEGEVLEVGNDSISDRFSKRWYKVRTRAGAVGYIPANEILTERTLAIDGKVGLTFPKPGVAASETDHQRAWKWGLRAMGLAGSDLGFTSFGAGFDGEVAFNFSSLFSGWHTGYNSRRFAVGVAFVNFDRLQSVMGSLIARLFSSSRFEPEFRIRVGQAMGLSVGARYPLGAGSGRHFALSAELGGAGQADAQYGWLSGGVSFHF